MPKYIACTYYDNGREFTHLFKTSDLIERNKYSFETFDILDILTDKDAFLSITFEKIDHTYMWCWTIEYNMDPSIEKHPGLYERGTVSNVMEFPDDKVALLWFKLNY